MWDPLISAEVPPSTHQGSHNFSEGSLALACVQVYLLLASISRRVPQFSAGVPGSGGRPGVLFASTPLLVGRKRVRFP